MRERQKSEWRQAQSVKRSKRQQRRTTHRGGRDGARTSSVVLVTPPNARTGECAPDAAGLDAADSGGAVTGRRFLGQAPSCGMGSTK